jgi:hypothetical protein
VKPLVYIAGPYTSNPVLNTRQATRTGLDLWRTGLAVPYVPHWSIVADLIQPMRHDRWLAYSCDVILHCDALLRLPGDSPGADIEVTFAAEHRIPQYSDIESLLTWAASQ